MFFLFGVAIEFWFKRRSVDDSLDCGENTSPGGDTGEVANAILSGAIPDNIPGTMIVDGPFELKILFRTISLDGLIVAVAAGAPKK